MSTTDEILYSGLQPMEGTARAEKPDWRESLGRKVDEALIRYDAFRARRRPKAGRFLIGALLLGAVSTAATLYTTGYGVVVDGQRLGVVADRAQFEAIEEKVTDRVSTILGREYTLDSQVEFHWQLVEKQKLSDLSGFETYLFNQVDEVTRGYVLTVDGEDLAAQADSAQLEALLDELKAPYVNGDTIVAEFTAPVGLTCEYVGKDQLDADLEQVRAKLTSNTREAVTYTVRNGDTYSGIAHRYDMTVSELMAINPEASLNRLLVGDQLTVSASVPFLGVRTIDKISYEERIAAPVKYVEDSSMYQGDTKVLEPGADGAQLVDARVTYLNGMEQEREITGTRVLSDPVTKVMAKGTKERPKTMAKGNFIWPVRGTITSRYGGRSLFGTYNFHGGLDIAVPYGTPVKAADGGRVIVAGWHNSYGNYVVIDHENGKQTYYAHNSKLLVSVGQRVYQGEVLAKAGSTGNSTGPHCHFEVRLNGQRQNPINYLP